MEPAFFLKPAEFRRWLQKSGAKESHLWLGFYKKGSEKKGVTYQEALDEALCYGWIDGVRKSLGEEAFVIRFSPRKPRSRWSAINIKRAGELQKLGRLRKAGLDVFQARKEDAGYSIRNHDGKLPAALLKKFKQHKKAWEFHQQQPPGYRKLCAFWIGFAKREETKLKRLQIIIDYAEKSKRVPNDW